MHDKNIRLYSVVSCRQFQRKEIHKLLIKKIFQRWRMEKVHLASTVTDFTIPRYQ